MPPIIDKAEVLAEQLAKGLAEVKTIVENLREDLQDHAIVNESFKNDVKHLNANVEKLNKIVLDVHASDSFAARLIHVEKSLISLQKSVEENGKNKKDGEIEDKRGRWQMKTVLITSGVSLVLGIFAAIMSFLK